MLPRPGSDLPFPTKEPEEFQAEFVVTAVGVEDRTLVSRKGDRRRIDFNFGKPSQHSVIESGGKFLLLVRERIFTETKGEAGGMAIESVLPDARTYTEFEEIGSEGNIVSFLARSDAERSEVIIHADRSIGLPVKQEFYSLRGDDRILQYTSEMRNFRTGVDDAIFTIPENYRKVSRDEFFRRYNSAPAGSKAGGR